MVHTTDRTAAGEVITGLVAQCLAAHIARPPPAREEMTR
ncbi:hypothetical protein CFBP6600_23580 [Xanthomonas arboricola pv. corylina]|uniref:Uncharacterized protein n=1 Tax=Xanthomonas arboricola pv. corylina TaxID=487821 RepID=A0ABN7M1B4_9XANT|nr:hypothetical protein XAC301_23690 [Xanthomonas arboricola pv. corylina]CAE6779736.1 hypothetical protein XAC301_23690 [Xanthomonas arboricola pv. corylina]CAE6780014.1 hypothetical protein CFBP6600_23580 [Xanthomonas arboricola pv. corylina]CAE6780027.1 hypothetical protein CFBP6600_23580 [Xanthomonas arboricola pv. corylina]